MKSEQLIPQLSITIASLNEALNEEMDQVVLAGKLEEMMENSPEDISSRYWLSQFLTPLSRAELKEFVNGFLVQLLTAEQCKKLAKFLLIRYPNYYNQELQQGQPSPKDLQAPEELDEPGDPIQANKDLPSPSPVVK